MAESSWPSPAAGRVVDDTQWEKMGATLGAFHGVLGDFTSPQLIYADGSGRQIKVAADRYAMVRGHVWYSGSSITTVSIAANASGSTRVDAVVLRLSRTTWDVTLTVIQGTPGAGAPAITQGLTTTGSFDMLLAQVTVANNASTLAAGTCVYYGVHLDPMGGRVRIPDVSLTSGIYSPYIGQEFIDAAGLRTRWNGSAYTSISDCYHVGSANSNADSSTWTGTESGSLLSLTVALVNGQKYALSFQAAVSSTVASTTAETSVVRLRQDSAAGGQLIGPQVTVSTTSTVGFSVMGYTEYTATATGNKTFVLTGERLSGTGSHQLRAGGGRLTWITCDRIG